MSLPFFGVFLALAGVLAGWRKAALVLWALAVITLMVLFRLHATDPLHIAL